MLKLYDLASPSKRYWETWENEDSSHIVHWGPLGERGETKTVKAGLFRRATKKIQSEIDSMLEAGFHPIADEDHHIVLIEYEVNGFGTEADLDKRHQLEHRMNQTLGWTGLGHCDGGSIGSGTMEACCYVVDVELAFDVIKADLKGTEFADYTRIFKEGAGDA